MSKTVEFKMRVPQASPMMRVSYLSTISTLVGHIRNYPKDLPAALRAVRIRWLLRTSELLQAGWEQLQSTKFMFARNCPPCCVQVDPWRTPCNLPICPFCFARRVEQVYLKVSQLMRAERGTVLTYRQYHGYIHEETKGIFFDCKGDLRGNLAEVMAVEHQMPKQFRETYLQDAIGGFYWYTLAPQVYNLPAYDGSCGKWLRLHSCVAVMPPGWDGEIDDTIIIKNPSNLTIAKSIGNIFRYQKGWLASDAAVMATFLNAVKGKRFLSPFGYFKRVPTTDTNGAASRSGGQVSATS